MGIALPILPNPPTRWSHPHNFYRDQNYRCWILWRRTTSLRHWSFDYYVKQNLHAFWLQDGIQETHATLQYTITCQAGIIFPSASEILWPYGFLVTHFWENLSMFSMKVVVADPTVVFLWEGNRFIMQVFIQQRYTKENLNQLNRVQISLQVLFMSGILTVAGHKVNPEVLSCQPPGDAWWNIWWPNEQPTELDFQLWRIAIQLICPSQCVTLNVGQFIALSHRI